jgi:hypothetical protein
VGMCVGVRWLAGAAAGVAETGKAMADFFLLCLKRAAVRWEVGRLDDDRL